MQPTAKTIAAARRGIQGLVAATLAVVAVLTQAPDPASACSCAFPTVDESPGAVVAEVRAATPSVWVEPFDLEGREAPVRWPANVYELDVIVDAKDNLEDVIWVEAIEDSGANCGLTWQVGEVVPTALHEKSDGSLSAGSCSFIAEEKIVAFAESAGSDTEHAPLGPGIPPNPDDAPPARDGSDNDAEAADAAVDRPVGIDPRSPAAGREAARGGSAIEWLIAAGVVMLLAGAVWGTIVVSRRERS